MLVELQCYWELQKTDIFMFGTPFIPLAKIHCFLETNKFLSKKNGFIQRTPCFFKQNGYYTASAPVSRSLVFSTTINSSIPYIL